MPRIDGTAVVLDFLQGLQPKIQAQVSRKVFALGTDPLPQDSANLAGYSLLRVDCGEYRIIYEFDEEADVVTVVLIGRRNDSDVYKKLSRLVGGQQKAPHKTR